LDSGKWTDIRFCRDSKPLDVLVPFGLVVRPRGGGRFFRIDLVSLAVVEAESQEEVKSSQDLVFATLRAFLKVFKATWYFSEFEGEGFF